MSMSIYDKISSLPPELRLRLLAGAAIAGIFLYLLTVGSFSDVITYFGPLFVSTSVFLVSVAIIVRLSPPPVSDKYPTAEEILEFVTQRPASISPEGGENQ